MNPLHLAIFISVGIAIVMLVGIGNRLLAALNSFAGRKIIDRVARSDRREPPDHKPDAP